MDNARQQIVDTLKSKSNILVTVSTNPTVDELAAALGLTIILNNQDKRASAIFGGTIPSAMSFLQPEKTFENTPDSLRDFIIALDKEKADHLRYKVEGDVVKIFITPYKTTLSEKDLQYSQGDYNVELVVALGVQDQDHLDRALEAHGKILHDATVVTITVGDKTSNLGSVDWHDGTASSLSEMVVSLADGLKGDQPIFDEQIATALLTGIVSATDRFSNDKTTSRSMTMSAQLMASGANQQLIATKLQESHDISTESNAKSDDGSNPNEPVGDGTGNELTIDRPGRTSRAKITADEKAVASLHSDNANDEKQAQTQEEIDQLALEKELAGLTAANTGTMEDIEKELQKKTKEGQLDSDDKSLTAPTDATMPDFEAPEPPVLAPQPDASIEPTSEEPQTLNAVEPEPVLESPQESELPQSPPEPTSAPALEPPKQQPDQSEPLPEALATPQLPPIEPLAEPPQIMNDHGPMSSPPDISVPPINSIQNNPNEGEPTVDPFGASVAAQEVPPVTPDTNLGTPEGAALLASEPDFTTPPTTQAAPLSVPELPPLPPLPTDANLPPLPPPPPPPPILGEPPAAVPSAGAVSGDIFGDGMSAETVAPASPPPPAPEPGQFRIPGQPV